MIERTYLQWVGTSNYPTIEAYVDEARQIGVCKKLPNLAVATEIEQHVTVIFLAHDQGRFRQCLQCAELVTCPKCHGSCEVGGSKCMWCKGLGSVERGTGGQAIVDGETWSYIRLLQVKKNKHHKFWKTEHTFGRVYHCQGCGGRGRIPLGVVFGFFVPAWVAFSTSDRARVSRTSHLKLNGGAHYAVSPTREVASRLGVAFGPDPVLGAELKALSGPFVVDNGLCVLEKQIPYDGKHFRGVKRWEPPDLVGDQEPPDLLEGVV